MIEAHLDKGRGPVATVLVQRGSLDIGDALVSGTTYCKIRAMQDENGVTLEVAGPSKPVQLLGWEAVPASGDEFREVADEREARHVASEREAKARAAELVISRPPTLSDLLRQAERAEIPELNLVVKADVQGSLGALTDAFLKLPQDEVRVNIVRNAAGGITENDVSLAMASDAIVIGFNVRPDKQAVDLAEREGVDIRTYRVIYDAIDDIKLALSGMLPPEKQEHELGQAEVRQIFRVPRLGVVAGCYVTQGTIPRDARVRLVRDGIVVYHGQTGVAAPVQGRREGSRVGLRVRHRHRGLPGRQGRRRDRGLRGPRGGPLDLMFVALQRFDLRIRESHSLKQKRHVVKALTAAIRQRFNVSVAEVDHQDLWQRATIAVAAVGGQEYHLRSRHERDRTVRRDVACGRDAAMST